jgi:uncharacterized membrane protein YdjX (TVP38/TMEM64 family)
MGRFSPQVRFQVLIVAFGAAAGLFLLWIYRDPAAHWLSTAYRMLIDREKTQDLIARSGPLAPLSFMGIQFLQVLLAPIPGEATGFIGGYLFGALRGFIYSSISLSLGSWVNFVLGRLLGRHVVRKWIPEKRLEQMDRYVLHQGVLVLFALFVFPGFPKDYLCLFLGMTRLPMMVFLPMAVVGRMPGTLMLSLQGALLFERMYGLFAIILAACAIALAVVYRYRSHLYRWIDNLQNSNHDIH